MKHSTCMRARRQLERDISLTHCTCILFLPSFHMLKKKKKVHTLTCRLLGFHSLTIWGAIRVNYAGNVIIEHFLTKARYAINNRSYLQINWLSGSHSNIICHRMPDATKAYGKNIDGRMRHQYLPIFRCFKLPVNRQTSLPSGMTAEATWNQATHSSMLKISHPQVDSKYQEAGTTAQQTMR